MMLVSLGVHSSLPSQGFAVRCFPLTLTKKSVGGGEVTIFAWDEAEESFRALRLLPKADTLLLFRSDRVLYQVAPAKEERFTLQTSFLGHYT